MRSSSSKKLRSLSIPDKVKSALIDFTHEVKRRYPDAKVYLFGSYAKNTWLKDSDVDVIVVSNGFSDTDFYLRPNILRKLARKDVPFEILAYTFEEFNHVKRKSVVIQDAMSYWIEI